MDRLLVRVVSKYRRTVSRYLHCRTVELKTTQPIISFSFDDAPRTAFANGGNILRTYGARATYFVSLGLLGLRTEVGTIALAEDLLLAAGEGNEIGCHTFDHLYTWQTTQERFVESVVRNKQALRKILPGTHFRTFAYPIGVPKPSVKLQLEKHFVCCRGGGQTSNIGSTDLNLLKAYFLDKRNNKDINLIKKIIDYNTSYIGWLIFATHDVTDDPSPYGCTPKFFSDVVDYAARSGSLLLPVVDAVERLQLAKAARPE